MPSTRQVTEKVTLVVLAALASLAAAASGSSLSATDAGSLATGGERLPKINIYISRNEIRKLLGIDARINYVTNGNIDTYPLGFTIPLGYNQSDMIFTWQNLGQTNVNYSISLVIGNIQAVNSPLINITRSGLIPKHEQVFKITLPCSGKVTDEVDVQVLINIAGAPAAEELASEEGPPVSHTLAIKRKKICTMHPVQVPVQPRPANNRWPFGEQPAEAAPQPQPAPVTPAPGPRAQPASSRAPELAPTEDPLESNTRKLELLNLIQNRSQPEPPAFPGWPATGRQPPLADLLNARGPFLATPSQQPAPPPAQQGGPASPLVLGLAGLSLLISALLVLMLMLGSAGRHSMADRSPWDKMGALMSCLLSKTSPAANKCKRAPPMVPVNMSGSFRASLKQSRVGASASTSASSSPISGHKSSPAYCFKQNCLSNQYLHQHYQQPPTADLLGAGYLCSGQPMGQHQTMHLQQGHPECPIYHIATSNGNQTTRLIWNNGNGVGSDGFTIEGGAYMPLSNAARSDSGSVYQTIY